MLRIVLDKVDNSNDENDLHERYQDCLKDHDVTAKAIDLMFSPTHQDSEEYKAKHKDLRNIAHEHTENNRDTTFTVPTKHFNADRLGHMTIRTGKKCFRMTEGKRVSIPGTARTIPFGFKGELLPLK
ncbi:UNVERIFIED_CONTAM: hypothetical protein RMT77_003079 [Armadillidium vulgare]